LELLVDGSFAQLEERASAVPIDFGGEQFNQLIALVDGIYPQYSWFMKGIKVSITASEKAFTEWQEAARKDIDLAFGVLQSCFQIVACPFHAHSLIKISNTVAACLIMHNMCMSHRAMEGNVYAI
jgi:Plant transposon protein